MLAEAIIGTALVTPFPTVALVFDYLYHRDRPRRMFADRLLESTIDGVRRVWDAPKLPYVRSVAALVKLAFYRQHETYLIAWTARNELRTYHTRVTRYSRRAAVKAVKRQPWVRKAGRFMLLEVTVVPHNPTMLESDPLTATVPEPKTKKTKAAPKPKRKVKATKKAAPHKRGGCHSKRKATR